MIPTLTDSSGHYWIRSTVFSLGVKGVLRRLTRCGTLNVPEHDRSDLLPSIL
jgi:hypothetical protein